jgi:hypothetical protein
VVTRFKIEESAAHSQGAPAERRVQRREALQARPSASRERQTSVSKRQTPKLPQLSALKLADLDEEWQEF